MSGLIHERSPEQVALDELVLERVKRGMALLEEKYGPSWVDHMKLSDLRLESSSCCVLGQLYGDYSDGLDILDIQGQQEDFGFTANHADSPTRYLPRLQEAWERVLTPLVARA